MVKMNLLDCTKVFRAIQEIENERTDFSTAHALVMGKQALAPHTEFYSGKERELVEKYALPLENGIKIGPDGRFKLSSENAPMFAAEKAELDRVEVEIDLKPRKLKSVPALKPATLEILLKSGLFEFEDE